jgi:hypothetical protein
MKAGQNSVLTATGAVSNLASAHRSVEPTQKARSADLFDHFVDEENWKCFVNSVYDKETKTWTCLRCAHVDVVGKSRLFKQRSQPGLAPRVGSPVTGRREASGFFVSVSALPGQRFVRSRTEVSKQSIPIQVPASVAAESSVGSLRSALPVHESRINP